MSSISMYFNDLHVIFKIHHGTSVKFSDSQTVKYDLVKPSVFKLDIGSVRKICGVAHSVSLVQRILGGMAHVRRLIQEGEMHKPNMKRIVAPLRQLSPSQLKAVAVEMAALETRSRLRAHRGKAAKRGLSHVQVPVLVARDRAGVTADCVLKTTDAATLAAALKPFVPADLVLCSDGSAALAAAARQLGVEHHAINLSASIRVDGAWHIQNINAYHSRLKTWVRKFNGVATRYPANYLGWFRTMDRESAVGLKPDKCLASAMGTHA